MRGDCNLMACRLLDHERWRDIHWRLVKSGPYKRAGPARPDIRRVAVGYGDVESRPVAIQYGGVARAGELPSLQDLAVDTSPDALCADDVGEPEAFFASVTDPVWNRSSDRDRASASWS